MHAKHLISLGLFLVFFSTGFYGLSGTDYLITNDLNGQTLKWCGIPALLLALYYSYLASFGYDRYVPTWRNAVAMLGGFFVFGIVIIIACKGILILINSKLGQQQHYHLKGAVIDSNVQENRNGSITCTLYLARKTQNDTIALLVPYEQYRIGEQFEKQMKIGSLGYIYSN